MDTRISQRTIACLGDSITYGHGVSQTRKTDAWPFVLQRLFGGSRKVLNFGICGATAIESTPDSYEASGLLDKALSSGAEVFILMLGTNDTKDRCWNQESYAQDMKHIINRILDKKPEKLFLMLPPKAFCDDNGDTAFGVSDEKIKLGVIPELKKLAAEFDLPIIDLYSLTEQHPEYYLEGVHPNIQGNKVIAEHIFSVL